MALQEQETISLDTIKKFYKNYNNGHIIYQGNKDVIKIINRQKPKKVFEFGCGTGKNLNIVSADYRFGIDISVPAINEGKKFYPDIKLLLADETLLPKINDDFFDVSFTVSVLDHINSPTCEIIIEQLKRLSKKVYLVESNDKWQPLCFAHDYESMGFEKLDYTWISPSTKAVYNMFYGGKT